MNKKLSVGITIESVTPAHTRFKIFSNLIPYQQDHTQATRASLGDTLCLRNEEFRPFMARLRPDILVLRDGSLDGRFMEYWNMQVEIIAPGTRYSPTYYRLVDR